MCRTRLAHRLPTDLMGNQIDLAVLPLVMAMGNVKAGNIKAFGITEPERSAMARTFRAWPNFPISRAFRSRFGMGCSHRSRPTRRSSKSCIRRSPQSSRSPLSTKSCAQSNTLPSGNSPKEFAAFLAAEHEKFSALVKATGIKGGIALFDPVPFEIRKRADRRRAGQGAVRPAAAGARIADVATLEIREADIGIVGPMIASVHASGTLNDAARRTISPA